MEALPEVIITNADLSDIDFLFYLRNQPDIYEYFRNPNKIKYEDHIKWIKPIINQERQGVYLYVIWYNKTRVGQIRFDLLKEDNSSVEISISILKEYRGRRIAHAALKRSIESLKREGIKKIIAEVKKQNLSSISFFKAAGFEEKTEDEEYKKFECIIK